jgi:hypothetical protein
VLEKMQRTTLVVSAWEFEDRDIWGYSTTSIWESLGKDFGGDD